MPAREQNTSKKFSADYPIIGWSCLDEELTRPEVFRNIVDAGINVFMTTANRAGIRPQLDLAREYGLKAMVRDDRFQPSSDPKALDAARRAADEYADHEAAWGYFVLDEPGREKFEDTGAMVACLREAAPEKVVYVNAFGFGGRGCDCFYDYVDQYASIIKPDFLSFDHYPISRHLPPGEPGEALQSDIGVEVPELDAYYRDGYWEAWETFIQVGRRHNLPLWGFVLAAPHQHSGWFYGPVNEGTLRLEVFTGLAYGAQATQYFTLPTKSRPGWEHGILDPDGKPSMRYPYFRRVNRDLRVLGPVMAGLSGQQIYYTGPLTSGCRRFRTWRSASDTSHRPITKVSGDPVILSFQRDAANNIYLLVVNRHPVRSARVWMELEEDWVPTEILKNRGEEHPAGKAAGFWCGLEAGDGRLFRLAKQT